MANARGFKESGPSTFYIDDCRHRATLGRYRGLGYAELQRLSHVEERLSGHLHGRESTGILNPGTLNGSQLAVRFDSYGFSIRW